MKERVELNDNGLSIESSCCMLIRKKWEKRYIVCRKQADLGDPVLVAYQSRTDRYKNRTKQSLILSCYVGSQRGFAFKNKAKTLALITKNHVINVSFAVPENLVQWETWFKTVCGQSTSHYMQVLKMPSHCPHQEMIQKEVICLLHDSRMALVYGMPQTVLLYCDTAMTAIKTDVRSHFVAVKANPLSDEEFLLSCASIDCFVKMLSKATTERGELHHYMSKKSAEGSWLNGVGQQVKKQDSLSQLSDTLSTFFNIMNSQPSTSAHHSEHFSSRFAVNQQQTSSSPTPIANELQKYRRQSLDKNSESNNYMNVSRQSSIKRSNVNLRAASLPEYVNVRCSAKTQDSTMSLAHSSSNNNNNNGSKTSSTANLEDRPKRRKISEFLLSASTLGYSRRKFESLNSDGGYLPSPSIGSGGKGQSMMDFSSLPYDQEPGSRYENWKKAKKFISAFGPKSQNDISKDGKPPNPKSSIVKSSSTSALQYSTILRSAGMIATSSMSEIDELPPSLNTAAAEHISMQAIKEQRNQPSDEAPTGLVRLREETPLEKQRGGVNILLARRLGSTIRGSFSKYDGEKITHHYAPEKLQDENDSHQNITKIAVNSPSSPAPPKQHEDAIAAAVSRRQDEMKASDRRASSVSFQKAHVVQIKLPPESNSARSKAAAAAKSFLSHFTGGTRSSTTCSESTRASSVESLSSDARSKISIKKCSNSPPKEMAPRLNRQISANTLNKNLVTSADSLSSDKTAHSPTQSRTPSPPPVVLPYRPHQITIASSTDTSSEDNSSSPKNLRQSSSMNSSLNESRGKSTSLSGFSSTRRLSQGQGSNTSGSATPQTQGFFRKHRRIRRSNRTSNTSSSQPNLNK